jgi:hypothetical protein
VLKRQKIRPVNLKVDLEGRCSVSRLAGQI